MANQSVDRNTNTASFEGDHEQFRRKKPDLEQIDFSNFREPDDPSGVKVSCAESPLDWDNFSWAYQQDRKLFSKYIGVPKSDFGYGEKNEWQQLQLSEFETVEGAETIREKLIRANQVITWVIANHNDKHTVFLVCHGGFLQDVIASILQTPKRWRISIKNTAIFDFSIKLNEWGKEKSLMTNRFWQINSFNDHSHLL